MLDLFLISAKDFTVKKMTDFIIKAATAENKQEIYDLFISSFFEDMPLFKALGVTKPFGMDEWPAIQTLENSFTLLAVSKNGEIMGYAINVVPTEGKTVGIPGPLYNFFDYLELDSKGLLTKLEKSTMELRVMCVGKKWRGLGIASKLVEESENLAKKSGYKSIFGIATGAYMEKAFEKHGWKCIYRLKYEDYTKHNKDFILPPEPHTSLTFLQKVFDDDKKCK